MFDDNLVIREPTVPLKPLPLRGTKVPPETPSFTNVIYIVFDINHLDNIKFFLLREGFQGNRRFPD